MSRIFPLVFSLLLPSLAAAVPVHPAQLIEAKWLDGSAGLDISGLSFCNGELLAVSDKDSGEIYSVDGTALQPSAQLAGLGAPQGEPAGLIAGLVEKIRPNGEMDFEGISCDGEAVYLVSERHNRIARLQQEGKAEWLPQRWAESARASGYLKKFNAGTEGLVRIGSDFWIALEREPRGLLHLSDDSEPRIHKVPPVPELNFRDRSEDLTGLAYHRGALYTLERNALAVCRRSLQTLNAEWCIDYRHIEEAPEYIYAETKYGKGEGLAVKDSGIYVVLDNNNVARAANLEDKRALLLHLSLPPGNEDQR